MLKPLFELGRTVATPVVLQTLTPDELFRLLQRHSCGDWGDMSEEDRRENELALKEGLRIFSSYQVRGEKVWVITEADRSITTVLLPDEY